MKRVNTSLRGIVSSHEESQKEVSLLFMTGFDFPKRSVPLFMTGFDFPKRSVPSLYDRL
jgi:hypothetical protein